MTERKKVEYKLNFSKDRFPSVSLSSRKQKMFTGKELL